MEKEAPRLSAPVHMEVETSSSKKVPSATSDIQPSRSREKSFKDALADHNMDLPEEMSRADLSGSKLSSLDVQVNMVNGVPDFHVNDEALQSILESWRFTVVVKLFVKEIGYLTLMHRIKVMWKPIGGYRLIDQANQYYLVQFVREDDFML